MIVQGTKIKQGTVNYCKEGLSCEDCRCTENECIAQLYYISNTDKDI